MRWTLILAALALAGIGIWSLDTLLDDQAWMTYDHQAETWTLAATGWGLLLRAWPVLLVGLLAGLVVGYAPGVWSGSRAADLDLAEREQQLASEREQAETWAQQQDQRLAERESRLQAQLAAARRAQSEAEASIADARQRIAAAEARAADAEARRTNAAAVAERRRRQLARQRGRDAPPGRATGTGTVPATPSTITAPGRPGRGVPRNC